MAEISREEAQVRMTRWVSIAAAMVMLGFFGAAGFGCQQVYKGYAETWHDCVAAGSAYITGIDGKPRCLPRGTAAACIQ